MGRKSVSEEIKRAVVEQILAGGSISEAAAAIDVSEHTVQRAWRKWGAELGYKVPECNRIYNNQIPDETKKAVVENIVAGAPVSKIGIRYGLSETMVQSRWREWAEQFGIEVPPPSKPRSPKKRKAGKMTAEERLIAKRKRAVHLKAQGWRDDQVAQDVELPAREIGLWWKQWARMYGTAWEVE